MTALEPAASPGAPAASAGAPGAPAASPGTPGAPAASPGTPGAPAASPGAPGAPPASPGGGAAGLAERQAGLVAALTSGAPVPEGFDPRLVAVARTALLNKRAGEVARQWPGLAAAHGRRWTAVFSAWAAARPTQGSWRDGWDLARHLGAALPPVAAEEIAVREAQWRYDGRSAPRRRRMPAVRTVAGCRALQIAGRVRVLRRARDDADPER